MPPINDRDLPPDPNPTVLRLPSAGSMSESMPDTFPSAAESLLKHLKLGAARSDSPTPSAPGAPTEPATAAGPFPYIPGYEIEGELGRGGMGIVYKARHAVLRHTVAIKMIQASAHADAGEVTRFVAEAEAVAQVKHPNVVQVFDLGVAPGPGPCAGRPYFIMEYIDGGNLAAHLKAVGGALAPDPAAELIETVARGVDAANAAGVVHRDLKPANILLQVGSGQQAVSSEDKSKKSSSSSSLSLPTAHCPLPTCTPKVSDFGLAKRLSADLTRTLAVMGTPAYMAPEQAGGKAKFVGPQADVYALGVILYQCLTGAVPFDDPDPWALIRQVLENTPSPVRAKAPHVSRDLELICLKCLEKEPHHRYPTAAALADDLRRFLNREAVSVRPIGPATRLVRWAKKRPAAATATAAAVLLGISIPAVTVGVKARFDHQEKVNKAAQETASEAHRARGAAEQLAETRELFGLQNKMRTRAAGRPLGWTTAVLDELPRAVTLARDAAVLEDLRSVAAAALLSDDLFPAEPVLRGTNAAAIATDPTTGLVAVGEHKGWLECKVFLIDPRTGAKARTLSYPPVTMKGRGPLDVAQDGARALTFSPDGKRLFVGTRSGRVVRFDLGAKADTPALVWQASDRAFGDLVVSTDNKTVYTMCRSDEPVRVWAADTGAKQKPLELPPDGRVFGIAGLPGGVIAAGGDKFYQWDASGRLVASVPAPSADRVAVGPESMLLVSSSGRLLVCDRTNGAVTGEFTDPALRRTAHGQLIKTIAFHPSRTFVATAAGDSERIVRVWEVASGRLINTFAVPGAGPIRLAWSRDGEFLLVTAREQIGRWRLGPAAARQFACGTALTTEAATFLPDGRVATLTELSGGRRELMIGRAGEPATPVDVTEPGGDGHAGLSSDPNGRLAITLATKGLCLWAPGPPFPPLNFTGDQVRLPRFGNDGRTLWAAFGAKDVRAITPDRAILGKWDNTLNDKLTGLGTVEVLAAGRARAAVGTRDGSVYLLDAACNQVGACRPTGDPVLAVAVAPDDSLVAVGTQNGNLRLIRVADATELPPLPAHPTGVSAVAIGPNGALLATGGRDGVVRLWLRTGDHYEPLLTMSGWPDAVRDLQFHPTDGRLLVVLEQQHAVRIWDIARLNALLAEHKLGW